MTRAKRWVVICPTRNIDVYGPFADDKEAAIWLLSQHTDGLLSPCANNIKCKAHSLKEVKDVK